MKTEQKKLKSSLQNSEKKQQKNIFQRNSKQPQYQYSKVYTKNDFKLHEFKLMSVNLLFK